MRPSRPVDLGGVLEPRQFVGAGDGQRVGAGLGGLADALVGEALAAVGHDVGVEPHAAAAAAAAQGVVAVAGHLHQLHARDQFAAAPAADRSTRSAGPRSSCRDR